MGDLGANGNRNGDPPSSGPPAGVGAEEDFLYHLYRGSELLVEDRVVEAKDELERALRLQPQDAKSQDLLAGVYFRLGMYPRAIDTWTRLVEVYPRNPTLRINLGLAYLKTSQPETAREHLRAALRIAPEHERAWGYLGLVCYRLGELEEARDAFLRGGQASMAKRMESMLEEAPPRPGSAAQPLAATGEAEAAMRSAAEEAIDHFESEGLTLESSEDAARHPEGTHGPWSTVEPGQERVPRVPAAARGRRAGEPPSLTALVERWEAPASAEAVFSVGSEGELHVHSARDVFLRVSGIRAVRGPLKTSHVSRRTRGRELDEGLGGDNPIFRWQGPVAAIVGAGEGRRFVALHLTSADLLYVREELLWGFGDAVGFESGRLPLGGAPVVLTQLYGEGAVALRLPSTPTALRVESGQEVRVAPASLVGWTGRLFPDAPKGTQPYGFGAPPLAFRGEGLVLVA